MLDALFITLTVHLSTARYTRSSTLRGSICDSGYLFLKCMRHALNCYKRLKCSDSACGSGSRSPWTWITRYCKGTERRSQDSETLVGGVSEVNRLVAPDLIFDFLYVTDQVSPSAYSPTSKII